MKSRYAVLLICTFLLINQLTGQVVRYNDTFTIYHPIYKEGDRGYGYGRWGSVSAPGKKFFKGRYKDSLPEGRWEFYHVNGSVSEIHSYKKGLLNDTFYKYHYDSTLAVKGKYSNNIKTGTWEYHRKNGNGILHETRTYVNDTQQGWQKIAVNEVNYYEDLYFVNGKADGPYHQRRENDGIEIKGQYTRDMRIGAWYTSNKRKLFSNYDSVIYNFKDNKLDDTSYYFINKKLVKKTTYREGKKNGPEYLYGDIWYANDISCKNCMRATGYLTEDFWDYERKHGIDVVINEQNDTLLFGVYEKGNCKGIYLKFPDGKLKNKTIYGEGFRENLEYHQNGRMIHWELVKSDMEDIPGEFTTTWDSLGRLIYKDTLYYKGNFIGEDHYEYNNGKIILEKHWLNWNRDGRWFEKGKYEVYYKSGKVVRTVSGFLPEDDIPELVITDELIEGSTEESWNGYSPSEAPDRIKGPLVAGDDPFGEAIKSDVAIEGFKGIITVRIFINDDGYPSSARILTPVNPEADAAALRQALTHHWPKEMISRFSNKYRWKDVKVEF